MIVYKWVHKKDNKYYSLLNFGYFKLNKSILINQEPYEIGKTYINDEKYTKDIKSQFLSQYRVIPRCVKTGFYFWKENRKIPIRIQQAMIRLKAPINAVLKCKISEKDILSTERQNNIRAKKFKVLEEVK